MLEFLRAPEWGGLQGLLGILALWLTILPYISHKRSVSQTKKDEQHPGNMMILIDFNETEEKHSRKLLLQELILDFSIEAERCNISEL